MTVSLSIVVASFRERRVLDECLAALVPQCAHARVELIVARRGSAADCASVAHDYPSARVLPVPLNADLPRIRGAGLALASGRLSALTEDHCVPSPDWSATWMGLADSDAPLPDVIGGCMDNGQRSRAVDWGAFFAEYGFFAGSGSAPRALITAANVVYSSRIVAHVADMMQDGAWENVVHDRLRSEGARFEWTERALVAQNLRYQVGAFARDRFEHGYDYARVRLRESTAANRWLYAFGTFALPALLTFRIARVAVNSAARVWQFSRALPFTVFFLSAWAAGECAGYLEGPAPRDAATPSTEVGG